MFAAAVLALLTGQDVPIVLKSRTLPTVEGKQLSLPRDGASATVLLFIAVDCPISNRYAPEMGRVYKDFSEKQVDFVRVYLDDSVPVADIVQHGKDFKMPSSAVLDSKHELVKALGMTVTPEVAVIGRDGTLQYRGRIDDRYAEHGRLKEGTVRRDLREALAEVLAGTKVSVPFTTAIGCGIPDG